MNMTRKVPFHVDYKTIEAFNRVADWLLYLSVIIAALILLLEYKYIPDSKGDYQRMLNGLGCFLSVGYFIINIIVNYLFQCAEVLRRNDFFDNSLRTTLTNNQSEEYFTNEAISPGIYKLGANSFENSFFSKSVATKMLKPAVIKSLMVLLLFLSVAIFAGNKWLITILQLALPFTIIEQTIRLFYYKSQVERVYENFLRIFVIPPGEAQNHLIIHNMVTYESAQSWATIKLDSKIFTDMNPQLTREWDNLKIRLNIH